MTPHPTSRLGRVERGGGGRGMCLVASVAGRDLLLNATIDVRSESWS